MQSYLSFPYFCKTFIYTLHITHIPLLWALVTQCLYSDWTTSFTSTNKLCLCWRLHGISDPTFTFLSFLIWNPPLLSKTETRTGNYWLKAFSTELVSCLATRISWCSRSAVVSGTVANPSAMSGILLVLILYFYTSFHSMSNLQKAV